MHLWIRSEYCTDCICIHYKLWTELLFLTSKCVLGVPCWSLIHSCTGAQFRSELFHTGKSSYMQFHQSEQIVALPEQFRMGKCLSSLYTHLPELTRDRPRVASLHVECWCILELQLISRWQRSVSLEEITALECGFYGILSCWGLSPPQFLFSPDSAPNLQKFLNLKLAIWNLETM